MKKLARVDEIPNLGSKLVFLDETPIALFNINGEIHAWDNRCPHRGASLSDGYISESTIQCKYHLWEFDINRRCSIDNSKINKITQTACKSGTSITVKNLFFNIPARKNFLKSDKIELKHIIETFIQIALSHHHINFNSQMMVNNYIIYRLKILKIDHLKQIN